MNYRTQNKVSIQTVCDCMLKGVIVAIIGI